MLKTTDTIIEFGPPVLVIECARCNRQGQLQLHTAIRRYGAITVAGLAQRVASDGACPWVKENCCTAFVQPTPVTYWATLATAHEHGWRPVLHCQRRHYALKRVAPCSPVALDLTTLIGTHGRQCTLLRLERWARCPNCSSGGATIRWVFPNADLDPRLSGTDMVTF